MTHDPTDLDPRLRDALEPTAHDHEVAHSLVDRVIDTPASRRRPGRFVPAAAAAAALVLAAGVGVFGLLLPPGDDVVTGRSGATSTPAGTVPGIRIVRCTPNGAQVDGRDVVASSDGVHLRVVDETGGEVDVQVSHGGQISPPERWGRIPPRGSQDRVQSLVPGDHRITCLGEHVASSSVDGQRVVTRDATITVHDPDGYWRGSAADAGCPMGGVASWVGGPGHGDSPEEAVRAWPSALPKGEKPASQEAGFSVRPAAIGYVDAPVQYWVVDYQGRPSTLLRVFRTDEGGGYEAQPEWPCRDSAPGSCLGQ